MAKGRIVDPDRDVALTLTKTDFTTTPSTTAWALQEMTFDITTTTRHRPRADLEHPGPSGPGERLISPGALAVGDVDGVVTINARR